MEEVNLDSASKRFFVAFFGLILCSLLAMFWRHIIIEDYTVFIPEELGGEAGARQSIPNPENLQP